jgi:hypothetical protein
MPELLHGVAGRGTGFLDGIGGFLSGLLGLPLETLISGAERFDGDTNKTQD